MWKVAVSPKEEHVLVLSSKQQIYNVSDMTKDQTAESRVNSRIFIICHGLILFFVQDPFQLELVFHSFHELNVRGLDIAIQKPLFISSGDDHSVRLWNYENNIIEQMKFYHEPVKAISIHPSGHQIAVAFASKVSLFNVLIDGFYMVKEFPIHNSPGIKFKYEKIFSVKEMHRIVFFQSWWTFICSNRCEYYSNHLSDSYQSYSSTQSWTIGNEKRWVND